MNEAVAKYKPVFCSLGKRSLNIHSDDESDDEDERMDEDEVTVVEIPDVKITSHGLPLWRSKSLTLLLWYLDALAHQANIEAVTENDGIRPGNAFRRRTLILDFGPSRVVPSGLPINWYSQDFVRSLEPWERELLGAGPPMSTDGIELVAPRMENGVTKEELEEFLSRMKDASMEDLNADSMHAD